MALVDWQLLTPLTSPQDRFRLGIFSTANENVVQSLLRVLRRAACPENDRPPLFSDDLIFASQCTYTQWKAGENGGIQVSTVVKPLYHLQRYTGPPGRVLLIDDDPRKVRLCTAASICLHLPPELMDVTCRRYGPNVTT